MTRILAVVVVVVACGGSSPAISNHGTAQPVPPNLSELRAFVRQHADIEFDAPAHDRGCSEELALHGYLEQLEGNGTAGDVHYLRGGCGAFPTTPLPIDPPADAGYWFCTVEAYTSDKAGDSPWHYALHVRVRISDRAIDLGTVACPGGA